MTPHPDNFDPVLGIYATCNLPTRFGEFQLHGFLDRANGREHAALTMGRLADGAPVLARVHSECLTGDSLFSQRCDCGQQLASALQAIAAERRGALLYLRQEGRGIGLFHKIRAYALQDKGMDTVDANRHLGFPGDMRNYAIVRNMFALLGISTVRLMTNNPAKIRALESLGIVVTERVSLHVERNARNSRYLDAKVQRMGHWDASPDETPR